MDMDRDKMAERMLHLTLEILFRLTGEDYTVMKKTSSDRCQDPVCEGWGRPLSPITGPPPQPLIHEDINDQKILELVDPAVYLRFLQNPCGLIRSGFRSVCTHPYHHTAWKKWNNT
ncbi:oocyte zinc finger protein XlCOF29-like [Dendrobates tinctorius]|uniref:oocyte zinc finger protein XlCOF29-like n=1 Tax=Dendrobates tinctorius TaxID=92724 RepID=UPI003CC92DF1